MVKKIDSFYFFFLNDYINGGLNLILRVVILLGKKKKKNIRLLLFLMFIDIYLCM